METRKTKLEATVAAKKKESPQKPTTEKEKDINEIIREGIKSGRIMPVVNGGKAKIGGKTYALGAEADKSLLFKIDESHYGLAPEEKLYQQFNVNDLMGDFTQLLTLEDDNKFRLEPYSQEVAMPKHQKETDEDYRRRLFLHQSPLMSQTKANFVIGRLEGGTGISLKELNVRERASLVNAYFFAGNREKRHYDLINFSKKFGVDCLKTFLACEYGMDAGEKIIFLGERLPTETARKIFAKYNKIVAEADNAFEIIKAELPEADLGPEETKKITENLLKKAKEMLSDFTVAVDKGSADQDVEQVLKKLDRIKNDIILFIEAYKEVPRDKKNPKEIKSLSNETKTGDQLTPKEREEMLWIFFDNWQKDVPQKLFDRLVKDFEQALEGDSEFYLYKYRGEIVSFIRFQDIGKDRVYVGSFNTRPEAKGAEFGAAMAKKAFDEKAKSKVIEATVYSQKKGLLRYYREQFKMSLVEIIPNYEDTGETFYRIERDDRQKLPAAEAA